MKHVRVNSSLRVRVAPLVEVEAIVAAVIPDSIVNAPLKAGAVAAEVIVAEAVVIAVVEAVEIGVDVATPDAVTLDVAAVDGVTMTSVATTTAASVSARPPRTTISRGAWMRMMIFSL
jgi:hypothetical protein